VGPGNCDYFVSNLRQLYTWRFGMRCVLAQSLTTISEYRLITISLIYRFLLKCFTYYISHMYRNYFEDTLPKTKSYYADKTSFITSPSEIRMYNEGIVDQESCSYIFVDSDYGSCLSANLDLGFPKKSLACALKHLVLRQYDNIETVDAILSRHPQRRSP
jgi:hypothetical protein